MSDLCRCPMCGYILRISEEKIDDDEIVGCTSDEGGTFTCNNCSREPYGSDGCNQIRKELNARTLKAEEF